MKKLCIIFILSIVSVALYGQDVPSWPQAKADWAKFGKSKDLSVPGDCKGLNIESLVSPLSKFANNTALAIVSCRQGQVCRPRSNEQIQESVAELYFQLLKNKCQKAGPRWKVERKEEFREDLGESDKSIVYKGLDLQCLLDAFTLKAIVTRLRTDLFDDTHRKEAEAIASYIQHRISESFERRKRDAVDD